jgi:hypothetical protein
MDENGEELYEGDKVQHESGNEEGENGEKPYDNGYCRPPEHSQFKKGQSGNPNGRPKGKRNMASSIQRAANLMVKVKINGRLIRMTVFEASCHQLGVKAMSGDVRSTNRSSPEPQVQTILGALEGFVRAAAIELPKGLLSTW